MVIARINKSKFIYCKVIKNNIKIIKMNLIEDQIS